MEKNLIYIRVINITLVVAIVSLCGLNVSAQGQTSPAETNPELAEIVTNAPPPGFATRLDYVRSFSREKDILDAYHSGKLSKEEAMLALESLGDKVSMDTYGKVVDQDGQPVADVKVQANVDTSFGDTSDYHTKTDAQGLFQFLGLHGGGLGIELQKEGYYFDYMLPSAQRPNGYLPDPSNPMVLTMWKLHGAEPMVHVKIQSSVSCDGTTNRFDLLTTKMNGTETDIHASNNNGDLFVKLTRNPLSIDSLNRYKPFNWSLTLAITNGGLEEITNIYPNEAPAEGYQPTITLNFPTNMVGWKNEINNNYYFKSGQVYGRMTLYIDASRPSPPTYFNAEIYANPNGSRNLEFDPNKQINQ
jgi:hypothetical protein